MIFTAVLHVCQNYANDLPLRTKSISLQELIPSHTTHVHNLKKKYLKVALLFIPSFPFYHKFDLAHGVCVKEENNLFFFCDAE